ncbi:MAG TPA: hypothetical protein ENK52_01000 [Saprospiraceae bacterium]|nr:hypothetical protein [Saprospiraceae bacterium]
MQGVRARGGSRSFDKNKIYSPSIFAIPSKGFIQYASVKNEKRGYIVEFLAPVRENAWKYKSDRKAETFQSAGYITATQNILISKIAVSKNIFGKDSHNSILALDVNTGKKIFETDLGTKVPVDITNGFIDEANKEITVFGLYYKKGDKIVKDKSKGLFAYALDFEGKIKTTKYLSWEDNVNPFLPMDKRGKSNNPQFLYFHDIIKTKDGKIIAVGEQFYKAVSGKAVALKMLSSIITGSSRGRLQSSSKGGVSKLVIGDLSLFTFDKDFNLEGVNFVEKSKSDFYGPSDFSSAQVIALFAKIEGAFDYSFTQTNEDHSIIIINYLDYERRTGEKNGYTLGAINYVDGSFTTDKVKFDGEVDKVKIFPAKHGYVCIVEINHQKKKMNTLKMRLEKINY